VLGFSSSVCERKEENFFFFEGRKEENWAMPRARLVNLGPARLCWPIFANPSPSQPRLCALVVVIEVGGLVGITFAVASLPAFSLEDWTGGRIKSRQLVWPSDQ
jgi:hypothetical protein